MKILKFEILGMVFISAVGSLLHFAFEWLNRFWLEGAFAAVNESTWEHLKLAVTATLVWAVLENKVFKLKVPNFLLAKAISAYLMPVLIVLFFYTYKTILGHNLLVIDISIFVLAVIIGQMVSYKIMVLPQVSQKLNIASLTLLIGLFLAFVVFTFYPPHFFLFLDQVSGGYGIMQ
ncbi:MAG: DUF6512 family protein [Candidatus Gribaldobacteria bacterium]|nr:DUF6512 family protein [Candidatus Gribaldobacteria bacterium]